MSSVHYSDKHRQINFNECHDYFYEGQEKKCLIVYWTLFNFT